MEKIIMGPAGGKMFTEFMLAFIPIFVAVDAIGLLPIFVTLTIGTDPKIKNKIIMQSIITATCLAVGFIVMGRAVFKFLGITIADFMIAGGAILFCIAMLDLLMPKKYDRLPASELGVVPIGTPLMVGPAVLTTSLITVDQHGTLVTILAVLVNIIFVGGIFVFSDGCLRILGKAGANALSKVFALLLAAIAVMMMRRGVIEIILTNHMSRVPVNPS